MCYPKRGWETGRILQTNLVGLRLRFQTRVARRHELFRHTFHHVELELAEE